MKAVGIGIIVIALLIIAVPSFNNCTYEGKSIALPSGKTLDMKCLWTSRASLIAGVTLALVGLLLALSKQKETRRALAVIGAVVSALAISLPTTLIGVCAMDSLCVNVMKPSLIGLGMLGIGLSVTAFVLAGRGTDETVSGGAAE
jgi:hypothetical protein